MTLGQLCRTDYDIVLDEEAVYSDTIAGKGGAQVPTGADEGREAQDGDRLMVYV